MADQQSAEEALAIVRSPATGVTLESHGLVQAANDDGQIEANNSEPLAATMKIIAAATGLSVEDFEARIHDTIQQWEQHGGELFDHIALKLSGPAGETTFYIDPDGWKTGDYDELTNPLWGEALDDEVREVERALTREELDALVQEFGEAKRHKSLTEMRAAEARAAHTAAKKKLDKTGERLLNATTTDAVRCPVRLRDGVLVVLHPETFEVLDSREPTDNDRQLSLPNHEATDAADGIDRIQIRARLQEHESALAIARGVHAVPPQSEIDSWSTGVCSATIDWLDSIDRGETEGDVLVVLPVWVTGARKEQQTAHQQAELPEEQITLVYEALRDGSLQPLSKGTMRLDRATVVASMKRHGVIKGTSQHLTQVLRMVADCGGLPQFNQAVADAEGARLRLIYFIAKAKPCFDAVGEPDLRSEVLAEVGRMLKPN